MDRPNSFFLSWGILLLVWCFCSGMWQMYVRIHLTKLIWEEVLLQYGVIYVIERKCEMKLWRSASNAAKNIVKVIQRYVQLCLPVCFRVKLIAQHTRLMPCLMWGNKACCWPFLGASNFFYLRTWACGIVDNKATPIKQWTMNTTKKWKHWKQWKGKFIG